MLEPYVQVVALVGGLIGIVGGTLGILTWIRKRQDDARKLDVSFHLVMFSRRRGSTTDVLTVSLEEYNCEKHGSPIGFNIVVVNQSKNDIPIIDQVGLENPASGLKIPWMEYRLRSNRELPIKLGPGEAESFFHDPYEIEMQLDWFAYVQLADGRRWRSKHSIPSRISTIK